MMFISVDLPEPDGPMMETNSRGLMEMSTPSRAVTMFSPMWYSLRMPCIWIMSHRSSRQRAPRPPPMPPEGISPEGMPPICAPVMPPMSTTTMPPISMDVADELDASLS